MFLTFLLFAPFYLPAQSIVQTYQPDRLLCETLQSKILTDGNILFFGNCLEDDFSTNSYSFYEIRTVEDELLHRKVLADFRSVNIFLSSDGAIYFTTLDYNCDFVMSPLLAKIGSDYEIEWIIPVDGINDFTLTSGVLSDNRIWTYDFKLEIFNEFGEEILQVIPQDVLSACPLTDSIFVAINNNLEIEFRNIYNDEILESFGNVPSDFIELETVNDVDSTFLVHTASSIQFYKRMSLIAEVNFNPDDEFLYQIDENGSLLFSTSISENQRQIVRIDGEGDIVEEYLLFVPSDASILDFDMNDSIVVSAGQEIIAANTSYGGQRVAFRQIHHKSNNENFIQHDIGIVDVVLPEPFFISEVEIGGTLVGWEYKFKTMSVVVENFGDSPIESFQIRSFTPKLTSFFCNEKKLIVKDVVLGEPLQAGETITIEFEEEYLDFETMSGAEFCIWTSAPNLKQDSNATNDVYCTFINDTVLPNRNQIGEENLIHLFPNPTNDILTIETINTFDTYRILNQIGQVIEYNSFHSDKHIITKNLEKGIYFIELIGRNDIISRKFIRL